ncbi:TraM recognition domain-containing protein [Pseudonocardia sp. KRD-184]|uniref:TraM recognition domain-containing protein n=1 Tax=Pseudonocardia oceani TaxID=2792013 RepID=A0ABS6U8E2_9PSEU|nr:TraM recognition domain-containing protein [Pseudonocardia oceani]MBW0091517.1 TraM recognition domain-containing protein [Pseudonocardia oceani]MBW0096908.1 TraM recognition domain-containing protein [Pseudonocardia oceani]MBW0123723.1 TraM recognition domain-containing protein [Pseudonocardia oceani]MBW0128500.1 TraM recognition domain-containing protein [Pseudonocardia oceani]
MNVFLLLVVLVVAAAVLWRRGSRAYALLCVLLAGFPALTLLRQLPWWAYPIAAVLAAAAGWHHLSRSAALVTRWSGESRRKAGVASTFDILRHASARAMRQRATTVRPSLGELGRWARWRLPAVEVAIELCRAGWLTVWSPVEDVVMIFGGPRTGKTGWLAGRILDAPGAVLVTSTRTDLYELCAPLRARSGPVYVFNPVGLGGDAFASTITFDPLTGCADPVTASERATDMIAAVSRAGGGGDREFWNVQARRVLTALLHAAALGDKSIHDVGRWVANADDAAREVPALLRRSGVQAFEQDLSQFLGTNEKTRTSITSTVAPALGWLTHPAAEESAKPGLGFDVEWLLAQRATVFLLGGEETQTGALVCALTGHIAREARRLAASSPKGRLDPPLALALDEAALISPVPLENWTADMGGRGVTIIAAFQSRAQLLARWGEHNTATILNNCGAVMVFGGTRDRDDLQFWSTLAGDRDEPTLTTDMHGRVASRTTRRVPVLPAAQLANLPSGRVMLIRRGLAPVIGRVQMAWQRRDVRRRAFQIAHPALATRLARSAATARRWWSRLTSPVVAALRRIGALVGRFWRAICASIARARRWIRDHLTPTSTHDVLIDLDPPTVELPVQAAHTSNGQTHAHTPGGAS